MPQIITANRVTDGLVVFLAADGGWTENVNEGRVVVGDDEARRVQALAEASARAAIVIEPYAIDVTRGADGIRPVRYRERIRAFGPSIHPDFAKQADARPLAFPRVA